jgi:hypothetical protein
LYQEHGIHKYQHIPISSPESLLEAASTLHYFINYLGLRVYIHCQSSVTRAPSVILLYLCLYKKTLEWSDPLQVAFNIMAWHPPTFINVKSIVDVIQ